MIQVSTRVAIDLQRIGLAARAIQGEHQQFVDVLPSRMPCRLPAELRDYLRVIADHELRVRTGLERLQSLVL